ncbi:AarF/ABC1/UbiB kinase family protein [Rhodoplanes sp. TEM]|uniref:AarF/ABC1/UbiB kinase family protein n=1 Tax=Rhodoplanes tepidamans TaxID=200616 RepID=A0ABT5JFD4_RHOTP|nr:MULTISPECIES: AarF/ABC1/UbiB kinase family protein [Rhodoplanes]MDC7787760.1 AarF/ABC1/UbiB kinase family protein [Rhodoplanes tepidamans]MDC7982677.1 AarF/ABC1/UbiB kinase family protein [Rhodoplanes sp. TEM]MDQ0357676.1 putative unusual protein kinase regulating ubiquinone biosynthesis (AarF/ABC1/UbiB family) [Rhodoplanes tepidamans]
MPHRTFERKALAVPSSRLSRLAKLGGLASSIAGNVAGEVARHLARGERPRMGDLLLTPANAMKVADELARMRGAAMKVGQLISMDAGDMLPPELAQILARLRADAHHMPWAQLKRVLTHAWGTDWRGRFETFETHPVAAASIGQVHRARTRDGRDLAIKVQYPGVRKSIDSDVGNVAALLRLAGLVPRGVDIAPMLAEARRQLHEEADYEREGRALARFGTLIEGRSEFHVPALHGDLTTPNVLAMSYVEGRPVEELATAPQAERDRVMTLLIGLLFRELFEFRLMQTDPNFANYRYAPATGRVILLDFGATRAFPEDFVDLWRRLLRAGLARDRDGIRAAALQIGFLAGGMPARLEAAMLAMFEMSLEPLRQDAPFDFGASDLAMRMRDAGLAMAEDREYFRIPPMDTLFLQRKFGGMYLLATRMRARVDLRSIVEPYL